MLDRKRRSVLWSNDHPFILPCCDVATVPCSDPDPAHNVNSPPAVPAGFRQEQAGLGRSVRDAIPHEGRQRKTPGFLLRGAYKASRCRSRSRSPWQRQHQRPRRCRCGLEKSRGRGARGASAQQPVSGQGRQPRSRSGLLVDTRAAASYRRSRGQRRRDEVPAAAGTGVLRRVARRRRPAGD